MLIITCGFKVSNGYCDIAVFCYSKDYVLKWIKTLGNENCSIVNGLVIDNETAFFAGNFRGELETNDDFLKSNGSSDILLGSIKLNYTDDKEESLNNINNKIIISPNPSNGHITIMFENECSLSVNLKIFDMSGKIIWSSSNNQINKPYDFSFLNNGVYQLKTTDTGGSTFFNKMIISH